MPGRVLPPSDLVIDAAYGTGFRGEWFSPDPNGAPVLAVDIPSGVDGATGTAGPDVLAADRTVTFAALKPGLVFAPGSVLAGRLEIADIGLDVGRARTFLVQGSDVAAMDSAAPRRRAQVARRRVGRRRFARDDRCRPASRAQRRSGPARAWCACPAQGSATIRSRRPRSSGSISRAVDGRPTCSRASTGSTRSSSGRASVATTATALSIRTAVTRAPVPVVIDGDGLFALAWSGEGPKSLLQMRTTATVLTPHDGEYTMLTGTRTGPDRLGAARRLASDTNAVVLLKGPSTVVAEPGGRAYVVTAGDARLATAGTGDVLAGIIGALLATGVPAFEAAAAGAWIHGQAGRQGHERGLVASDLLELIPVVMSRLS